MFMGDAGSTLIGFTVIWLLIIATQGEDAVMRPVTALWLIAVPLMDMLRVMMGRIRRGDSPFRPDREHLHHVLLRVGFSGRQALLIMTFLASVLSCSGLILNGYKVSEGWQLILYVIAYIIMVNVAPLLRKEPVHFSKATRLNDQS
ncbi:MAG: hypothetical protein E7H57_13840 [Pantoea sp.]|nr:hypothetical protein [Pantoea sp.]